MKVFLSAVFAACLLPIPSQAQTSDCYSMRDLSARHVCYLAVARQRDPNGDLEAGAMALAEADRKAAADLGKGRPPASVWSMTSSKDPLDDSTRVVLQVISDSELPPRFGNVQFATLTLRCDQNTTAAYFTFGDYFMADIQGYGRINLRVDDKKATHINARESTDHSSLGLWSGSKAIPFIKSLLGGDSLYIEVTPFNENPLATTFTISGLDLSIGKLRDACHW